MLGRSSALQALGVRGVLEAGSAQQHVGAGPTGLHPAAGNLSGGHPPG